jgi:hypothetical protein
MTLVRAIFLFAASLFLIAAGEAPAPRFALQPMMVGIDGVGQIKVGMTVAEAERIANAKLVFDHPEEPVNQCTFGRFKFAPDLGFMLMHRVIVRADVFEGTIKTAEGAGIGTSEDEVKRIYANAKVEVSNHAYVDGHYLEITMPGFANHRYIFETDGKKVTAFRAGRLPEVGYIEGCA